MAALSAMLAGCYTSNEPVLDKGEWAPLAGTFSCEGIPGPSVMTMAESKTGFLFSDYSYSTRDGEELKLKKIGGTLHLAQVVDRNRRVAFVYLDFVDSGQFVILVADLMTKGPYIKAIFDRHGVAEAMGNRPAEPGTINLGGSKSAIVAFLTAHDRSLLSALGRCQRRA